jgi:hypothetical protein
MEHQQVVTTLTESPAIATVDVSTPVHQAVAVQPIEQPKAQAFVAEPPAPESAIAAPAPIVQPPAPVEQPPAPVVAARPEAPTLDAKEVLSGAGLVMIETDLSRSKSYVLEEAPVQLGRPRRERPMQAAEELKQVETKN